MRPISIFGIDLFQSMLVNELQEVSICRRSVSAILDNIEVLASGENPEIPAPVGQYTTDIISLWLKAKKGEDVKKDLEAILHRLSKDESQIRNCLDSKEKSEVLEFSTTKRKFQASSYMMA